MKITGNTVIVGGRREARGDYDQVVAALNAADPHSN